MSVPRRDTRPYEADDPLLDLVGDTPLVRSPTNQNVLCKLETENPTRSMKDRVAMGILVEASSEYDFDTVVEASSGNTAGAVAFVANRLGLECHVTCPETTSQQKIGYMKAFGATVHLCPSVDEEHSEHYHSVAKDLVDEHDAFFVNQYENQANPEVHYRWTGPEIWQQAGETMTHLVCAMGTGGTLSGAARFIKERAQERDADVNIVGVDAENSNISAAFDGSEYGEYDTEVEGLGKGRELPTMWFEYIDEVRNVSDDRAFEQARSAAVDHGLLIGPSAGAALSVSHDIVAEEPDSTVVAVVCDGGEQYFQTLFGSDNRSDE
ncbi:PLP-dependent cysteine synthase family protein [Halovivax limisalsi]|uniref:PLP-dependent cysteine synthase family protein n=1 Tax=Halovivax limisalsi TaxID=1453760 RepID=UPI001FFC3E26|nr:cysteine synthase family protein [Halovivax limisalsi]